MSYLAPAWASIRSRLTLRRAMEGSMSWPSPGQLQFLWICSGSTTNGRNSHRWGGWQGALGTIHRPPPGACWPPKSFHRKSRGQSFHWGMCTLICAQVTTHTHMCTFTRVHREKHTHSTCAPVLIHTHTCTPSHTAHRETASSHHAERKQSEGNFSNMHL